MLNEQQIKNKIRGHYSTVDWRDFSRLKIELSANGVINFLKYLELRQIRKIVSVTGKVLDVGCGRGEYLNLLQNSDNYGVDISKKMVEIAKKHTDAKISIGDATNLRFKRNFFDNLLCIDTLHHLPKKSFSQALSEFVRVTKPKSKIIIDFKNSDNFIVRYLHKKDFSEVYFCTDFRFKDIKKILLKHDIKVIRRYGILFPSIIAPYVVLECRNIKC